MVSLFYDQSDGLWIGSLAGVTNFFQNNFYDYSMSNGLVYNRVDAIAKDNEGTMWFATPFGVSSYNGTQWQSYTEGNGLPDQWVTSILVDAENNIWFGTKTRGIAVLKRK